MKDVFPIVNDYALALCELQCWLPSETRSTRVYLLGNEQEELGGKAESFLAWRNPTGAVRKANSHHTTLGDGGYEVKILPGWEEEGVGLLRDVRSC